MTADYQSSRPRIEELRLRHFRAFRNARLVLSDLTVVVGRNGSGKTTLMEAFEFLQDCVTHSVLTALERRGGINSVVHRPSSDEPVDGSRQASLFELEANYDGAPSSDVELAVGIRLPVTNVLYGFTLASEGTRSGFRVKREILRTFPKTGFSFERREQHFESSILNTGVGSESLVLPLVAEREKVWELTLDALRRLQVYDFSPEAMQAEPRIGSQQALTRNGSNVGDVLRRLDHSDADMNWILRHLDAVTSGITRIQAAASAGRRIVEFFQQTGAKESRFVASEMSNGTLHSLGVLLALRQTPVPSLVYVDEIESSIHTAALASLMDAAAVTADERCQVILSTHSTDALSHPVVTADNVRIVDWQEDRSSIFHVGEGARELLKPPETVGRLLRSNALWTQDLPTTVDHDLFQVESNA